MLEVGKVLAAAKKIADHDERVVFLEEHFALVDRPVELLDPWIDACHSTETPATAEILDRVCELAASYAESPEFLSSLSARSSTCTATRKSASLSSNALSCVPMQTRRRTKRSAGTS
jgi:hypothetical protein